jgi:hypothetical protein
LLNHTSGLRSTPELFALAGWREGDTITTTDVYVYLQRQTDLNFKPGTEFMYSNSNYVLLAIIISRVTNQDFSQWMKANIFDPLRMEHTYTGEGSSKPTANLAVPYMENEEGTFFKAVNGSLDLGASNVYATATDLNKWMKMLQKPDDVWSDLIAQMLQKTTLSTGEFNPYNFGLITDRIKGHERVFHNGGMPGYLSFVGCVPEEELSIVVLANHLDMRAQQRVEMTLGLFLKNKEKKKKQHSKPEVLDLTVAKGLCASYWNINHFYPREVYLENDTLWYLRANGYKSPLWQESDSTFTMGGIKARVLVKFKKQQGRVFMYVKDGDQLFEAFSPFEKVDSAKEALSDFTGVFFAPELETSYEFSLENDALIGYHDVYGSFEVQVIGKDFLSWSGFATAEYERNEQGSVIGFYVSLNRVRKVWFEKK